MDIRAAEISDIIRKQIENYDKKVSVTETGTVLTAGDGIARVYGLSAALAGELPEFAGAGGGGAHRARGVSPGRPRTAAGRPRAPRRGRRSGSRAGGSPPPRAVREPMQ